jgi:uncharacterized protein (UPF0332 family)
MALADDLLEQAQHLATREPKRPRQASLRRAISTADYSLFHLLIAATILNWKHPHQRAHVAREFDHRSMKDASNKILKAFVELQQHRHAADYNYAKRWTKTEAQTDIDTAIAAFQSWKIIRKEKLAQDYLVSLLIRERKD